MHTLNSSSMVAIVARLVQSIYTRNSVCVVGSIAEEIAGYTVPWAGFVPSPEGSMQREQNRASTLILHRYDTASRPTKSNQKARYFLVAASRCHRVKTRKRGSKNHGRKETDETDCPQKPRWIPDSEPREKQPTALPAAPEHAIIHLRPLKESPANGLSTYDALAFKPRSPLY